MDENEFLQSLKTDEEKFTEFTAGAEHFIRMKQQAGFEPPVVPEAEKTASKVEAAREVLRRSPAARTTLIAGLASGAAGAGLGAATAPPGQRARGALAGGVSGAAGGAMSANISHHLHAKLAYEIQPSDRPDIAKKDFAQPHKEEAGHEGKYPIPDRQHARSALGFAKMHHDSAALAAVRAKIRQKYPDMVGGEEKTASVLNLSNLRAAAQGTADLLKSRAGNLGKDFHSLASSSGWSGTGMGKSYTAGKLIGKAAPIAAGAAAAHAIGKHQGKHQAEQEIYGDDLYEKRAALAEKLKSIGPLAGALMAGGAAVGGAGTYLASRPHEELGGKSRAEDELEAAVQAQQGRPEHGLLHKMKNRTTELQHGFAKAFREHPGKASIIGAGAGATGGYGLARLLDAVRGAAR